MNANERLYAAVSGAVPDRVPYMPKLWVDLAATLLGESAGDGLLEVVGDPRRALEITARAAIELGLDGARIFHLPARRLARLPGGEAVELDRKGRVIGSVDEAGGFATHLGDRPHFDIRDPAFSTVAQFYSSSEPFVRDAGEARAIAVPDSAFWDECGARERTIAALKAYGSSVALVGDLGSATFSFCAALRGLERTMYDLADDPELVHAIMDRGAEIAIEKARFNLGLGIRILRLNDSAGTMSLISPETWREYVFPRFRDIVRAAKAIDPKALVYCHICGDTRPIALDLAGAGIDCIGPLDPLGASTPEAIRAIVGDRVALMGGVDTMSFLRGNPTDVAREARACILAGGRKGGFTLGSGCAVPRAASRANILAARDVARATSYLGGKLHLTE